MISPSNNFALSLLIYFVGFSSHLGFLIAIIVPGGLFKQEAEKVFAVISKLMNSEEFSDSQHDLMTFLVQTKTRNLNVQNLFFNLDFQFFVAVSKNLEKALILTFKNSISFHR